jgi:hypothetical protein
LAGCAFAVFAPVPVVCTRDALGPWLRSTVRNVIALRRAPAVIVCRKLN